MFEAADAATSMSIQIVNDLLLPLRAHPWARGPSAAWMPCQKDAQNRYRDSAAAWMPRPRRGAPADSLILGFLWRASSIVVGRTEAFRYSKGGARHGCRARCIRRIATAILRRHGCRWIGTLMDF